MSTTKMQIQTDRAPRPGARYSQGIKVGGTLYVQGVIALEPATGLLIEGGIGPQAKRCLESVSAIAEAAGMTLADVVKVTAFLFDLADYSEFNGVYASFFTADPPPVRTTVQARLPFGALVEIEAIACRV